jgi:hypothetical protein
MVVQTHNKSLYLYKNTMTPLRSYLVLIVCFVIPGLSMAQSDVPFAQRLWYGSGFSLGLSGSNGTSAISLGLSPMVGYKIVEPWSVGPRVSLNYTHFRARLFNNQIATANPISWAVGLFSRVKVTGNFFAHVEYELAEDAFVQVYTREIQVFRRQHGNTFVGAGYNSGGRTGSEIMLLFNITPPLEERLSPFELRFGFTRNF